MTDLLVQKRYRVLPEAIWEQIRRQYEQGRAPSELCRAYGVSKSTLFGRRDRESWKRNYRHHAHFAAPAGLSSEAVGTADPRFGEGVLFAADRDARPELVSSMNVDEGVLACPSEQPSPGTVPISPARRQDELLDLTRCLRYRIEEMLGDERLGAGSQGRQSRAAVDLATALEKLQKIERVAMGLDSGSPRTGTQVVIVVPAKMSEDEWGAAVAQRIEPS
jgi:hypothetical protein